MRSTRSSRARGTAARSSSVSPSTGSRWLGTLTPPRERTRPPLTTSVRDGLLDDLDDAQLGGAIGKQHPVANLELTGHLRMRHGRTCRVARRPVVGPQRERRARLEPRLATVELAQAKLWPGQVRHHRHAAPCAVSSGPNRVDVRLVIIGRAVREVDACDVHAGGDHLRDVLEARRPDRAHLFCACATHWPDCISANHGAVATSVESARRALLLGSVRSSAYGRTRRYAMAELDQRTATSCARASSRTSTRTAASTCRSTTNRTSATRWRAGTRPTSRASQPRRARARRSSPRRKKHGIERLRGPTTSPTSARN